jgi:SAM-dependent methyltransferase
MEKVKNGVAALYEIMADEYYNSKLHPTCANFREASYKLVYSWLKEITPDDDWFCEVGAGKSLLLEFLSETSQRRNHIMVTDASPSMLRYSEEFLDISADKVVSSAFDVPLPSNSVAVILSSLGDSYNISTFWQEARRLVRPLGWLIYTTPSYEWSSVFRSLEDQMVAEFIIADNQHIKIPSWIYPKEEQIKRIEQNGFHVRETKEFRLSQLSGKNISSKLTCVTKGDYPIVQAYLAHKTV